MNNFFTKMMGANERVRAPHFAGTWYPSQPILLDESLTNYLIDAKADLDTLDKSETETTALRSSANIDNDILALIVPHAGYTFSGKTAAYAYQIASSKKYKRVFLLGPSHHIPFKGIVFPSQDVFATPLGEIQVDRTTVSKLLRKPYFSEADTVFDSEHSLEMQLPWIKKTLGKVKLIPMAVGMLGAEEIKSIAASIKNELVDGDLLIISSDFTHYGPRFEYEPFGDDRQNTQTRTKIKELDLQAFDCLQSLNSEALLDFYARTRDTICGIYPAALLLSLLPAQSKSYLVNYSTSQDFEKDPTGNSVSYMAIIFATENGSGWKPNRKSVAHEQSVLSPSEGKSLLKLARLSLQDFLQEKSKSPSEYISVLGLKDHCLLANHGVFVTLYKHSIGPTDSTADTTRRRHKQLRGCIGYIYPDKPVMVAVCENAINAATKDPRFAPVTLSEAKDLVIELNILSAPHYVSDWRDIKLGTDGIVFHKSGRQSVFLPKVASEFGWDLPQTLSQLSIKAGLSSSDWQNDAKFEVFQSQLFSE